jgi:hypothetical protein
MSVQDGTNRRDLTVIPDDAWFDCGRLEDGLCYHGASPDKDVVKYAYAHADNDPICGIASCIYDIAKSKPCPYLEAFAQVAVTKVHVVQSINIGKKIMGDL